MEILNLLKDLSEKYKGTNESFILDSIALLIIKYNDNYIQMLTELAEILKDSKDPEDQKALKIISVILKKG